MKKLLALLLAVVMVLGIAVTAFAATKDFKTTGIDNDMWDIEGNNQGYLISGVKVAGPGFGAEANGNKFLVAGDSYKWDMSFDGLLNKEITKSSGIKALSKALKKDAKDKSYDLEDGEYYEVTVDGVTFGTYFDEEADSDEQVFVVVDIDYAKAFANGGIVVEAKVEDGEDFIDKFEFAKYLDELRLTLGVKKAYYTGSKNTAFSIKAKLDLDDGISVKGLYKNIKVGATVGAAGEVADTSKIYAIAKAADGDEYDIEWGDYAMYTVVVKESEDNRNIAFTTAPDDSVLDAYPDVAMDFYSWPAKPRFDNLGTVTLYSDIGKYVYAIVDGKLVEVDAKQDDDEFTFKTRTLGAYVIAEEKLDLAKYNKPAKAESDNPYTGR
jgi:hypothetical protein